MVLVIRHSLKRQACRPLRYWLLLSAGGLLLGFPPSVLAQTAADHAAQAHGRPIVNGKDLQPTPKVVGRRMIHHRQMLKAEQEEAAVAKGKSSVSGTASIADSPNGGQRPRRALDSRDTEQLCHDLLHGGKRPANAASNPERCE